MDIEITKIIIVTLSAGERNILDQCGVLTAIDGNDFDGAAAEIDDFECEISDMEITEKAIPKYMKECLSILEDIKYAINADYHTYSEVRLNYKHKKKRKKNAKTTRKGRS